MLITAFGVRRTRPSAVQTHDSAKAKTITRATAARTPSGAAAGAEAHDQPEADDEAAASR